MLDGMFFFSIEMSNNYLLKKFVLFVEKKLSRSGYFVNPSLCINNHNNAYLCMHECVINIPL